MARRELVMPKLGLTTVEGALAEWLVPQGSRVRAGEPLFVVETDKVANEVVADADGTLAEVCVPAGTTVAVGAVIGYLEGTAPGGPSTSLQAAAPATGTRVENSANERPAARGTRVPATPLARRIARQQGIDLVSVNGSGPRGRIQARDIRAPVGDAAQPAPTTGKSSPASERGADSAQAREIVEQATPTQLAIARRLVRSKQEAPHFYLAREAEVSRLEAIRAELRADSSPRRPTLTHFVVAAVARVLHDEPRFNRVWRDGQILRFPTCDVGLAVDSPRGLLVPVLRDVGTSTVAEIARQAHASVVRAREGRLQADDMSGGAITVSNAGMHNVTWMTPIINPGQSFILGVGSVRGIFRPDDEGRPALRRELGLVLAADHRLFDGVSGLAFLDAVITHLERPLGLMM